MLKRPKSTVRIYDHPRSEIFLVDFLVRNSAPYTAHFHFSKKVWFKNSDRAETLAEGFRRAKKA